jgi:hypothetical protein
MNGTAPQSSTSVPLYPTSKKDPAENDGSGHADNGDEDGVGNGVGDDGAITSASSLRIYACDFWALPHFNETTATATTRTLGGLQSSGGDGDDGGSGDYDGDHVRAQDGVSVVKKGKEKEVGDMMKVMPEHEEQVISEKWGHVCESFDESFEEWRRREAWELFSKALVAAVVVAVGTGGATVLLCQKKRCRFFRR